MSKSSAPKSSVNFEKLILAVSHPVRWKALKELLKESLPTGVLAKRLEVKDYNMSKHMAILAASGVVVRGHGKVYHLRRELVTEDGTGVDADFAVLRLDRLPE